MSALRMISITVLCFAVQMVNAQATNPFSGNWKVVWDGEAQTYEAKLVLTEQGGSWKTAARQKNNPCVGREVPVKLDTVSATELTATLGFSEVIPGCKDSRITLKVDSGNNVTGKRGKSDLTLTRE